MNKIVIKLGGTIMALFFVLLLPLGYVANQIFTNFYYNQVQKDIGDLSEKYVRNTSSIADESIIRMYMSLAELTNKEIVILDETGEIIANSGTQVVNISEEDLGILSEGLPVQKRFHDYGKENSYLASGYPVMKSDQYEGALFVLASVNDIEEPVRKIRDLLILSAVGAMFLALGFTVVISKKMADPLLEMEKATREMSKGNLDVQVRVPSDDELGSLGKAINNLAVETNRYRSNRREFFANISHELRTPISYLQGYAKVLKQGLYQSEEEKILYLNIIEEETERLVRLINDLFTLSKLEEGKMDLTLEKVNLGEIAETAVFKVRTEMELKGLSIETKINKDIPCVEGDSIRLEQIIANLLGNSIRYTERGTIRVGVWCEKNNIHVAIEDTGVGIPKDDLPFIFERFHRVEKSRSRERGGTGLGLSIVKNLVEIQNGTITVESQIGKGTRFQLRFPIVE
ncbi:sensor histidine kinase [Salirhabdus salicampi]|uniref:sensor histidine kinase n=1 Tax=Salirhabdus salicampi TaxID=476102 RepID=UPI0020C4A959|nr:ATP-binding protein [Salirhabdus salicampi]MCP8616348.1 cell wall metabolism sensor histidine kinase WalK [Salirhabdus salicampi]